MLIYYFKQYSAASRMSKEAQSIVNITEENIKEVQDDNKIENTEEIVTSDKSSEIPEEVKNIDLAQIQKINSDVIGWIYMPGTKINYPVLECLDNDYYLHHSWNRKENLSGAIFVDMTNKTDFSDFNTMIYGHRMKDGSMFAGIKYFDNQEYFDEHSKIYIVTNDNIYTYTVFSTYQVSVDDITFNTHFENNDDKEHYINVCKNYSNFTTAARPNVDSKIITLSTCLVNDYSKRLILQAYRD